MEFQETLTRAQTADEAYGAGKGRLALALARAQASVARAPFDRENPHHHYRYSSADAVIATAKLALTAAGLSLIPIRRVIEFGESVDPKTGEVISSGRTTLYRQYSLVHESGEAVTLTDRWPIVVDKGRPLDRATAMAATSSLSYILRDLLLIQRGDEADADSVPVSDDAEPVVILPDAPEGTPEPERPASSNGSSEPYDFLQIPATFKSAVSSWGVDELTASSLAITVDGKFLTQDQKKQLSSQAKKALGDSDWNAVKLAWQDAGSPLSSQATPEQAYRFIDQVQTFRIAKTYAGKPDMSNQAEVLEQAFQEQDLGPFPDEIAKEFAGLASDSVVDTGVLHQVYGFLRSPGVKLDPRVEFLKAGVPFIPAPANSPIRKHHIQQLAKNLRAAFAATTK